MPRLVTNDAGVVSPNSLHILRLHPHTRVTSSALVVLWQTSLTRLSVEIEGHALGGGMLKLEPTEAENVMVPSPQVSLQMLMALGEELDGLIRGGDYVTAQARADTLILREGLGLSQHDCRLLRLAATILQRRRCSRKRRCELT
jgi:adenine-specific DNA-methyltransferase